MELKIEYVELDNLKPYEKNARKHQEADLSTIKASISEFGMSDPIGVWGKDNIIVEGHGRYLSCKELGIEEVPVIHLDHLTDEQRRAYALAHNKTAEMSEWDFDLLGDELADILDIDMSDFGFDLSEDEEEETEIIEDEVPEEVEPIAKQGDIWQLGRHRLMCGDSTSVTDVEKLMDGRKADMVFTDPPYNIAYQGVNDKRTIKNDKMSDDDFVQFLQDSIMKTDTAYVCCSWQYSHLFRQAMENLGMAPKAMIIWNKVNPAQHLDKYFKQHEIIWYFGKFGGEKTLRGDIWECKRQKNTIHPTMKPIELIAMALNDQKDKKNVYDAFGGSGSTLIACEQLDRNCFMMELDPHYVDVIIARWEQFTGQKAVLING